MRKTSLKAIVSVLRGLSIPQNRVIFVHSSLLKFGLVEKGCPGVYECLRDVLGPDATIVMPAFSFGYGDTRIWSAKRTPSEVGALTEYFRCLEGTRRTIHPFHSVVAQGPSADEIATTFARSSFGKGSAFDRLCEMGALNLSIGTEFVGGATFLHMGEEQLRVPYRTMKQFPGEVRDLNDELVDETFEMYARIITDKYQYKMVWDECWEDLTSLGCFNVRDLNGARFTLCEIEETLQAFKGLILADPFYVARYCPIEDS